MRMLSKALYSFCLIILLLHLWGTLQPSQYNWGVHLMAFYGTATGLLFLAVAAGVIIPATRETLTRWVGYALVPLARWKPWMLFAAAAAILLTLAFLFQSQGLLLGDSKLILLTTSKIPTSTEVSANYRNQPLFLLAVRYATDMVAGGNAADLEIIYRTLDILAGCVFLAAVFIFVGSFAVPPLESFLAGLFLMAGAGTQFFFGYIENYSLLYAFTGLYLVTGYRSLQGKTPSVVPLLFFACMAGFHLGALVFAPTLLVLFLDRWRKNRKEALIMAGVAMVASAAVFAWSRYSLSQFVIRMRDAVSYDVLPLLSAPPGMPYAMISGLHLVDWLNASLLVVPFALVPSAAILAATPGVFRRIQSPMAFLLCAAFCGLLFTAAMNTAIGMARDWDLLASFFLPAMFLAAYLFLEHLGAPAFLGLFATMVMLTLLHTVAWIGINADSNRHLRRSETLTNPLFMGKFAQLLFYDRLANARWDRKDYEQSKTWYERYLAIDSTNPRIVTNVSEIYRRLGQKEETFRMLKLAARLKSTDPGVYSNLSVEYYLRGDTSAAIAMGESSLKLAPNQPHVHSNLGIYYLESRNFPLAAEHLARAIEEGMRTPVMFRRAGDAFFAGHQYQQALHFYNAYLSLSPTDGVIRSRSEKLKEFLSRSSEKGRENTVK